MRNRAFRRERRVALLFDYSFRKRRKRKRKIPASYDLRPWLNHQWILAWCYTTGTCNLEQQPPAQFRSEPRTQTAPQPPLDEFFIFWKRLTGKCTTQRPSMSDLEVSGHGERDAHGHAVTLGTARPQSGFLLMFFFFSQSKHIHKLFHFSDF